jgi:hypothetical protein
MSVRLWLCPIVLAGCLAATYEVTGRRLIGVRRQPDGTCANVIEETRYYAYRDSAPTETVNVHSPTVPCPGIHDDLAVQRPNPPASVGTETPPRAPTRGDIEEIPGAMSSIEADIHRCARGHAGVAPVRVTYAADGSVDAHVLEGPFRDTPAGQCMELFSRSIPLPASVDRATLPRDYVLPFDVTAGAPAAPSTANPATTGAPTLQPVDGPQSREGARAERERERERRTSARRACAEAAGIWRRFFAIRAVLAPVRLNGVPTVGVYQDRFVEATQAMSQASPDQPLDRSQVLHMLARHVLCEDDSASAMSFKVVVPETDPDFAESSPYRVSEMFSCRPDDGAGISCRRTYRNETIVGP